MAVVACDEDSITEDSDNESVVANDKISNNSEIDGTSDFGTKLKTSTEKSDVSKDIFLTKVVLMLCLKTEKEEIYGCQNASYR